MLFSYQSRKTPLQEVLYELIDNSVKHHLHKGNIKVGVVEKRYYEFLLLMMGRE